MQVKEIKENLNIDLTEYEHDIIYISSLAEGFKLAFYGLFSKNYDIGLSRNDLHGFLAVLECLKEVINRFDDKFYSEVVENVEELISYQLNKK